MDFFKQQSSKRLQSYGLLATFLGALFVMGALLHFVVGGIAYLLGLIPSVLELSAPVASLVALFWLAILAGCYFRYLDIKAGGPVLARKLGAVPAEDTARDASERELVSVVHEMAIASESPVPEVFVLQRERNINAFVLGAVDEKRALVVTGGALDTLERDELQAVVAHEFGHIAEGDLGLNMRLLVALGGLMALDEIGQLLTGDLSARAFADRRHRTLLHPGVLVGVMMRFVGSSGVVFGSLIRSAFTRQREYLADAAAVQYTRAPLALASALSRVAEINDDQALHVRETPELVHLCFSGGLRRSWWAAYLASHPPLQDRIQTIDPHFKAKRRKQQAHAQDEHASRGSANQHASTVKASVSPLVSTEAMNPLADKTFVDHKIELVLGNDQQCLAALFALFVPGDVVQARAYRDHIAFHFRTSLADAVKEVGRHLAVEFQHERLGIIEHSCAQLRSTLNAEQRRHIVKKLEQQIAAFDQDTITHYASVQLVRRLLDVEFPLVQATVKPTGECGQARGAEVRSFDEMADEFALLLSLIVAASGADDEALDERFDRVLTSYTHRRIARRKPEEAGIAEDMHAAFQTLYMQAPSVRRAFIEHCAEITLDDQYVAPAEKTLLRLFAASLGCDDLDLPQQRPSARAA